MFLDEDEAIEFSKRTKTQKSNNSTNSVNNTQTNTQTISELPIDTNSKLTDSQVINKNSTNKRSRLNTHVIYKRNMFDKENSHSDYRKSSHFVNCSEVKTINFLWKVEMDSSLPDLGLNYNSTEKSGEHRSSRTKRQAPQTVWPEVLLVVDYDSYVLHGATSRDVKRYFISFWNGVDLRYKLLGHPQIRVSLAGMIVAKVSLFNWINKIIIRQYL